MQQGAAGSFGGQNAQCNARSDERLHGRAIVAISFELLHDLLHLKPDVTILTASVDQLRRSIDFQVWGPGLPPSPRPKEETARVPLSDLTTWRWE